jgi:probable HAF family extracellular repeat protein
MIDLGVMGGNSSGASDINDNGQIVGRFSTSGSSRAFLYEQGTITDLGTLGGNSSHAYAINALGQITGSSNTLNNEELHPFLYSAGAMVDLGTLGGYYAYSYDINVHGRAVGESAVPGNATTHAFLYSDGTMHDLNNLIDDSLGWVLRKASGINDAGQIVGSGEINGSLHAFLLTPVPEPSTLALLLAAALGGLVWRRRRA